MVGVRTLAQSEKGKLYLSGKVVNEKRRGLESTIYIFKDEVLVQEILTSKIGKFELEVSMQDSVAFVVYAEGYVTKTIVIDSRVHPSKQKKDHVFACFIDLYPVGRVPSHIDLKRPVGKIKYEGGQFIYDPVFTKERNEKLKEFVKERRAMKVRESK